jgi:hypothetical protein
MLSSVLYLMLYLIGTVRLTLVSCGKGCAGSHVMSCARILAMLHNRRAI